MCAKMWFGKVAVVAGMVFATSVWAQDTAKVVFKVNATGKVEASRSGASTVTMNVTKDQEKTMAIPLGGTNAVSYAVGARGQLNAPAVISSRGNISLRLPAQAYRNAEIALHSVNGRRILRGKAAATEAVNSISRKNVAAGVYLLSVKGINGNMFTTHLTHQGGNMNIKPAFGNGISQKLAKSAAEEWTIKISASGYVTQTKTLNLVDGDNPKQTITLVTASSGGDEEGYCDFVGGEDEGTCYEETYSKCEKGWGMWYTSESDCESKKNGVQLSGGKDADKWCCFGPDNCYAIGPESQDYKTEAACEAKTGAEVRDEYWEMEAGDVQGYCDYDSEPGSTNCYKAAKSICDANKYATFYATKAEAVAADVTCDW